VSSEELSATLVAIDEEQEVKTWTNSLLSTLIRCQIVKLIVSGDLFEPQENICICTTRRPSTVNSRWTSPEHGLENKRARRHCKGPPV
jgi:hypothetical protein